MDLADTPATWLDPASDSMLQILLYFVGLPLLIMGVITLLVMAPSLAKGPRYRPNQQWDAHPEWFGSPALEGGHTERPELEAAAATSTRPDLHEDTGGASVRW